MQRWANRQVSSMAVTVLSCSEILCLVNNTSSLHLIPSAASKVWGRQKANMSLIRLSSGKKSKVGVKLKLVVRAAGGDPLGDFGARDPFPAEIESNFGDKVLGNSGTDHKILIPSGLALSLANKPCTPIPSGQPPMSRQEATTLLRKVVGWRIVEDDDGLRLQCLWKVKNFTAGIELMKRIAAVAEAAGHHPDLHLEAGNSVRARIWTHSIGQACVGWMLSPLRPWLFLSTPHIATMDREDLMKRWRENLKEDFKRKKRNLKLKSQH